ncbi:ABC transporter permease [Radiobacillus sp. PE A8.2]|uniref:ABC transporter permease n=1 Tax=Radiobacillus sp. PE A8.2 TaxID=3380349 RepID=UPI00388D441C
MKTFNYKKLVINMVIFLVFVGIWQSYVTISNVSDTIFPSASSVGQFLYANIVDGTFLNHFWITFVEAILGFLIGSAGGILLAVFVAEIYWVKRLIHPYILASQAVPVIALAPLFIIWFGFGIPSKVALAVTIVFFPVLINTITGLENADKAQIKLLKAYSASGWQIFFRVKLPNALPYIFAGLEIAIVLSVIAAVVSEFMGAEGGLGYLIVIYNNQLNMAAQFSVFVLLAVIGIVFSYLIQLLTKKVVFWHEN